MLPRDTVEHKRVQLVAKRVLSAAANVMQVGPSTQQPDGLHRTSPTPRQIRQA